MELTKSFTLSMASGDMRLMTADTVAMSSVELKSSYPILAFQLLLKALGTFQDTLTTPWSSSLQREILPSENEGSLQLHSERCFRPAHSPPPASYPLSFSFLSPSLSFFWTSIM